mgnify:FL=1
MKITFIFFISILIADVNAPYQRTRDRQIDVHHSKIAITVNLKSESVSGYVIHTLSPLHSNLSTIDLDAEDMVISRARVNGKDIKFVQDDQFIHLSLDKFISWKDTVDVYLDYSAKPRKGLYFVSPDEIYPKKRWQAWTQGEEMDNHHWVPMYDYPNDRASFECILTVDKKFTALSNGELVSKNDNKDGTHTWHWRENHPMVGYLISFVVGEYVQVEDSYDGIPVNYWVYPENVNEALRSFGKTPDMMKFFNEKTGFNYPFEKYDQVIIEDFMFGGMENITLTHNTDRTMYDEFAAPDHSSDGLVAHELAHQWYGDLITTRNWANIWLNEGFATFFSRKYREHDLGYDEGEYIRLGEIKGYLAEDKRKRRPTVSHNFHYPMELFNSNVYAKGSLVLNMIQDHLGDDGFWIAIQRYTRTYKYDNVETADLKRVIEETTGQNMEWFFKQWLYEPGYPEYEVSWSYNTRNSTVKLNVKQTQNLEKTNLFKMPVRIQVDDQVHLIWIEEQDTFYELPVYKRPKMVVFNAGHRIPCKVTFNKSITEWILQLGEGNHILDRIAAAHELGKKKGRRNVELALLKAISSDPFWGVRKEAATAFGKLKTKKYYKELIQLTVGQDNRVKRAIYNTLKNYKGNEQVAAFLTEIIDTDDKYYGIADAFRALVIVDTAAARIKVNTLLNRDSHNDVLRIAAISYFGSVKTEQNYTRLKQIATYGGTTWQARPQAVSQLGQYVTKKPETVDLFVDYLSDRNRSVRQSAIWALSRYGNKSHFSSLDELAAWDPIVSRYVSAAKKNILKPRKTIKSEVNKELDVLNQKLNDIRKILE